MKKLLKFAILSTICSATANAAVSLQFSDTTSYLSNFLNGAGANNTALVWGVLVDTAGNGFGGASTTTPYDSGFSLNGTTTALTLTTLGSVASDDRLFIASGFMSTTATGAVDSTPAGVNRVLTMASMNMSNGVTFGQNIALIWFDSTTRVTTTNGLKYGIFVPPATNVGLANTTTANKMAGADGTFNYAPVFAGADDPKSMGFTLGVAVPEPSAALLGAIGALGLLRRRRI